jgi:hypothetical protein
MRLLTMATYRQLYLLLLPTTARPLTLLDLLARALPSKGDGGPRRNGIGPTENRDTDTRAEVDNDGTPQRTGRSHQKITPFLSVSTPKARTSMAPWPAHVSTDLPP